MSILALAFLAKFAEDAFAFESVNPLIQETGRENFDKYFRSVVPLLKGCFGSMENFQNSV